jgi:hypothetical protein
MSARACTPDMKRLTNTEHARHAPRAGAKRLLDSLRDALRARRRWIDGVSPAATPPDIRTTGLVDAGPRLRRAILVREAIAVSLTGTFVPKTGTSGTFSDVPLSSSSRDE